MIYLFIVARAIFLSYLAAQCHDGRAANLDVHLPLMAFTNESSFTATRDLSLHGLI
jgi:hypothetical protein